MTNPWFFTVNHREGVRGGLWSKKNLLGKICYKSYIIINQSQKSKSKFFTFSWPLLFVKILRLFTHWIWFIDTQNRFYFIVKRLKNAFLMHFQCLFNCSKTVKTVGIMECLKMAFGWPLPLFWSVQQKKGFFMASLPVTPVNFVLSHI